MPPRNVLIKWIGSVMTLEKEYERQKKIHKRTCFLLLKTRFEDGGDKGIWAIGVISCS